MTRTDILNVINDIIEEEHGTKVTESQLVTECGIDSFGYAMLWLGLVENIRVKTGIEVFSKEELKSIEYTDLTVSRVLDMIESKLCI